MTAPPRRRRTDSPDGGGLAASGFFALRTPLLPFDELEAWGEGLEAPAACDEPARLEAALAADRRRLRDRLRAALDRPAVREALFVASPSLDESFDEWVRAPDGERGQKVERTLVRYFARMAGRPTPFGLFAGCSVGRTGEGTRLIVAARGAYQRHTRLDMDYLCALAEALGATPAARGALRYRPNSSLYRVAGRLRYAESRVEKERARSHHLVAVEPTPYLDATLARARDGARLDELAAALVAEDPEIEREEADEYAGALVDSQLLVPDLEPAVTGPEPIHGLVAELADHPTLAAQAAVLDATRDALAALDAGGLGAAPERYRAVARTLEALPAAVELPRLFQVDMVKPAPEATLGRAVIEELRRGVALLHRIGRLRRDDGLRRFREAFTARYEEREVALVEALDEETGVGFEASGDPAADASPLLEGLPFAGAPPDPQAPWGPRQGLLLRRVAAALREGAREIVLGAAELEELAPKEAPAPLPDALAAMATIAAESDEALAQGRFRVWLHGVVGPSGAPLLGRFCHGDDRLLAEVAAHLRAEEALRPEALFAEIVHLPEGRIGNVICRPVLRGHEIPFLGRSGAPADRQLPITDLRVAVAGERVVLRSARLGREVVPRLTNAHNFVRRSLGLYRFLCTLQGQGTAGGLGWDWGVLEHAPFLPRLSVGRLVLARARWSVRKAELAPLAAARGGERFRQAQLLRAALGLPRHVAVADGDNVLPIDLDNTLSVDTFVHLVREREETALTEMVPEATELCARGPEGRFVHELVVPFVRVAAVPFAPTEAATEPAAAPVAAAPAAGGGAPRVFPPGSEWLYAKLYTGAASADEVLRAVVAPVVRGALEAGAADGWFFLRYGDPDWHVRVRLHGAPSRLTTEVLPALHAAAAPLIADGLVWKLQLDTYQREVERYGGPEGIALAERVFAADSEAVLAIVETLSGDEGGEARWRLTLRGMHALLEDLGLEGVARLALLDRLRAGFAREHRADVGLERQLGLRFRKERASLEELLDPARDAGSWLEPGFEALARRSAAVRPVAAALRALEAAGGLASPLADLAESLLHMHANRLLRSAARAQELVLYDFLQRLYRSTAVRGPG